MHWPTPQPFVSFVGELERLLAATPPFDPAAPPPDFLSDAADALGRLIRRPSWLPPAFAQLHADYSRQYLLYRDSTARFAVVSFVLGPGARTPIHDHQVWGLVGVLDGAEYSQAFRPPPPGTDGPLSIDGAAIRLEAGAVETLSPAMGDIHLVQNAFDDRVSISIHVYGADIGAVERWVYRPHAPVSARKKVVSGYSNDSADPPALLLHAPRPQVGKACPSSIERA